MCVECDLGSGKMPAPARSGVARYGTTGQLAAPRTPCFTEGSEVATDRGPVRIEDLRVGDRVLTRDSGYRPVRWIGARHFDESQLAAFPELRPMTIPAGALGPGVPARDLTVSPQHRMLVTAQGQAGAETEILVAATDLACARISSGRSVTYYHILFDAHEVVMADGAWSESFLPEAEALGGLHAVQRAEILTIFPELRTPEGIAAYAPARHCPAHAATLFVRAA